MYLVNMLFIFHRISLGSTTLSMTYSIDVHLFNNPISKPADEATEAAAQLFIAGAFLVDIIPVLKYVPEWFPGARFQRKAVIVRKEAADLQFFVCSEREINGM